MDSMYFDGNHMLSYGALMNFVVGERGNGKTFWAKKKGIDDFITKNSQFIYMRRHETEIEPYILNKFFADISMEYPEHILSVSKKDFIVNNMVAGHAVALSTAGNLKSISYHDVGFIIFDEFLLDPASNQRYLKNEVDLFFNFYETVARMRDVIVVFLGNFLTEVTPYFMDDRIALRLPYGNNVYRNKEHGETLLYMVETPEHSDAKRKTRFGKIISGSAFGEYAIDNKVLRDNNTFISKKTGNCKCKFNFKYSGKVFGVWVSYENGLFWVSNDVESIKPTYSITMDDHGVNTTLLKNLSKAPYFNRFIQEYKKGNVRFESQFIKSVVYDVIKLTIVGR